MSVLMIGNKAHSAVPTPCMISNTSGPTMCTPITYIEDAGQRHPKCCCLERQR